MVQLRILSGKKAGSSWDARRFPVRVGRSVACDLRFEEHGVWDEHFQILFNPAAGFVLETYPDALVTANGQPVQRTVLSNGDTIEIGALRLQFWLGEVARRSLQISEWFIWATIAGISLGQVALVYWLPR